MFQFLKKLFGGKKEEVVSSADIDSWFQAQIEDREKGFDAVIQNLYGMIKGVCDRLKEEQKALLSASLDAHHGVEPRVKSIVAGHRDNYCRELGLFLNNVTIPEQTNLEESKKLVLEIDGMLDDLAKRTEKSFAACRHLFHKEIDDVTHSLQELNRVIKDFIATLEKKGFTTFHSIHQRILALQQMEDKKRRLFEELAMKKTRLAQVHKQRDAKAAEAATIKESVEYKDYLRLVTKKEELVDGAADIERSIARTVLSLERALRKYEYLALADEQRVLRRYLTDPKSAFAEDETIRLWDIVLQLKERISRLGLKEDQEARLRDVIDHMGKEQLSDLRTRYMDISEKRTALVRTLADNAAVARLKEAEYKLDHFAEQASRIEKEIADIDEAIGAIDMGILCKELGTALSDAFQTSITVTPPA